MSTILKALRRLEQERAKGAERPLREQVVMPRARRRGPWAVRLAVGGALALGFAATWNVLGGIDEPPEIPAVAPAPVAAPPPALVPRPAAAPAQPAAVARLAAPAPTSTPAPVAGAGVAPAATTSPAPPSAVVAAPDPTPPRVASVPALPPRARLPEPLAAADEPVVTSPITGRAPRLVEEETPPRGAQAELPVDVVRTSWHPQAERRAAWVAIGGESPREVKEGEWVGAYEVRSIEPDGVLFADGPLLVHRPVGQR